MNVLTKIFYRLISPQAVQLAGFGEHEPQIARGRITRKSKNLDICRDRSGEILSVRIGSWRVISANALRRIASIQLLEGGHQVAVEIELGQPCSIAPVTTIWEVYDRLGRMKSMMQSTDDSSLWNETRCVSER